MNAHRSRTAPLFWTALLLVVAGMAYWLWKPVVPRVEVSPAAIGPMTEYLEEEGETRARDRYVVAAPVTGRLSRVTVREGDQVVPGQRLATLSPLPLDARATLEGRSRVSAAQALEQEARERVASLEEHLDLARKERQRAEKLFRSGDVPLQRYDQAKNAEAEAQRDLEAARHRVDAARFDVETARAAIADADGSHVDAGRSIVLIAPVQGRVLQRLEESERVITAGTQIVVIGDPRRLEVVVDVLSSDAVKIVPGAAVVLEQWGGDHPLKAKVRSVEPQAFRKVSALGVEERRVHVVADFMEAPERLGDGYRVEAKIVLWSSEKALKVPASAVFRQGAEWAVLVVVNETLQTRIITINHRTPQDVEVLSGLHADELVVVRPSRDLQPGTRVQTLQPVRSCKSDERKTSGCRIRQNRGAARAAFLAGGEGNGWLHARSRG